MGDTLGAEKPLLPPSELCKPPRLPEVGGKSRNAASAMRPSLKLTSFFGVGLVLLGFDGPGSIWAEGLAAEAMRLSTWLPVPTPLLSSGDSPAAMRRSW